MSSNSDLLWFLSNSESRNSDAPSANDTGRLNRQRGLWSFLTRSFYLGQMIVAQQFLTGGAQAKLAEEGAGPSSDSSDADASAGRGPAGSLQDVATAQENGATAPIAAVRPNVVSDNLQLKDAQATPGEFDAPPKALASLDGTPNSGSVSGSSSFVDGTAAPADNSDTPCQGSDGCSPHVSNPPPSTDGDQPGIHVGTGPDGIDVGVDVGIIDVDLGIDLNHGISLDLDLGNLIDLDLDIPLNVGAIVTPVIGLVDDVVNVVGDTVGAVAGALDALGSGLGDAVDNTLGAVANAVDAVGTGLGDTVGGTVGALAGALDDVGSKLGGPLGDTVSTVANALDAVGSGLDDAVSTTTGAVAGILDKAGSGLGDVASNTVGAVAKLLGDVGSGFGSSDDAPADVGSPGVITLVSKIVTDVTDPDTLFDSGKYTDLNIAMQSDTGDGSSMPINPITPIASLADALLGGADDADAPDGSTSDHSFGILSGLLHDSGKGGLAELFS